MALGVLGSGRLRTDDTTGGYPPIGGSIRAFQGAGDAAPDAWRRFVLLMLEAFRTDEAIRAGGASPLPAPPTPRQVMSAMRGMSRTPEQPRSTR